MTEIEVFADVTCPFTHVGLRRFVEFRDAAGRDDTRLRIRSWPLEVVNDRPLDPHFVAEEIDQLRAQLGGELFAGFREAEFPTSSMSAMALGQVANGVSTSLGEQVGLQLRDLLFEQGMDVSRTEVLGEVATSHGLDFDPRDAEAHRRLVMTDHAEGVEREVVGSPHYFTPSGSFFCPALQVARDSGGHLQVRADPAGFEEFVRSCLPDSA